jgi:1,4-dihydroxy-2-naphthoate octaprenyltransferase
MKLKSNETELATLGNLTITTQRVYEKVKDRNDFSFIPKEKITGVTVKRIQNLLLLQVGLLLVIGGVLYQWANEKSDSLGLTAAIVGAILTALFFITTKHGIVIESSSLKLSTTVKGIAQEKIDQFIEHL